MKAYKSGSKTSVTSVRTYADTAFLYLPAGTYDLEVKPLENSDVNAVVVPGVKSFDGKIAHQTVSFDGGKVQVSTLNNGEGWDAVVKVLSKDGKTVSSGRTYGKPKVYEVNPGVYDVEVTAMVIEGMRTTHRMENVTVKAGETKSLEHNFKSGIAMIGATNAKGLIDALVDIKDATTKKSMATGRTYTAATSNPKKFVLTPGSYEVTVTAFKELNGKKQTFTMVVKEGESVEKVASY